MGWELSPLQEERARAILQLPDILKDLSSIQFQRETLSEGNSPFADRLQSEFSSIFHQPLLRGTLGVKRSSSPKRIGVVFSGGPAPGGHNVIAGVFDAMKRLHPSSELVGFLEGPEGVIEGKYKVLDESILAPYRNQGGFDLIGSGRTKIETQEQLRASLASIERLELDGLVVIGGDDSNTNAAILSQYCKQKEKNISVVGVPKTIDGDIKNAYVSVPFGFDTACKVYAEMIGNIGRDAVSARKYYHFIKLMGRSASHITLECALSTHPNIALIGEEILAKKMSLKDVVKQISDVIVERSEKGKDYGVVLIPEGVVEFIPEVGELIIELSARLAEANSSSKEEIVNTLPPLAKSCFVSLPKKIQDQLLQERDAHGNVHVSSIESEKLFMMLVQEELSRRASYRGKFQPVSHFLGYEGRCSFPSSFDATYCYALGSVAALLVDEGVLGYMCFVGRLKGDVSSWQIGGVPLTHLMTIETRKGKEKPVIKKALVDCKSSSFITFEKERGKWACQDMYRFPGPIQFAGEKSVTDTIPMTLSLDLSEERR